MNDTDFDNILGTLIRQAIHNGLFPHAVVGIMEFHKESLIKQMMDGARKPKPSELVADAIAAKGN